ncbi:MAG: hypothetical protein CMJ46_09930 [Planctomyces sp.]|nr:hypothetical protein [Planctomyces sp.]
MPHSPLRYLHADQLNLDVPFEGISTLAPETVAELSTASLALLDNLLEAIAEESVPFVLLTGPLFGADPPSLAAQSALRNFASEVYELGVDLVLTPHPLERKLLPREYWNDLDAILLDHDEPARIELESTGSNADARLHVELQLVREEDVHQRAVEPTGKCDFSICVLEASTPFAGLQHLLEQLPAENILSAEACHKELLQTVESTRRALHVDYVALSGYGYQADNLREVTGDAAVYHAPGGLMVRSFTEASVPANGQVTTVTVPPQETPRLTSRRIAPVRLIPIQIDVAPVTGEHQLVAEMQATLDRLDSVPTEKRHIIEWQLTGDAPFLFELDEIDYRRGLERQLKGSRPVGHAWRINIDRDSLRRRHQSESLAGQYLEELKQFDESETADLVADFLSRTHEHPQLQHRLRQLGQEVSRSSILTVSAQQGASFILDLDEEEP